MNDDRAIARLDRVQDQAAAHAVRQDATAGGYVVAVLAIAGVLSQCGADLPDAVLYPVLGSAVPAVVTVVNAARVLRQRVGVGASRPGSWHHAADAASAAELADNVRTADELLLAAVQARAVAAVVVERSRPLEAARRWMVRTVVSVALLATLGGVVEIVLAVTR